MKKFLILAAVALGVQVSQATYLYWQVNSEDVAGLGLSSPVYAQVVATDGSSFTALNTVDTETKADSGDSLVGVDTGYAMVNLETLGSSTAYSFFIEVLNYNSALNTFDVVGKSQTMTYAQLQQANYIDTGDSITIPAVTWHGGSFTAVPEPTGALLVMFGMGLIALKRKKV